MVNFKVQEIIPLTIQGEGFFTGKPCSFIRLFGCPVGCYFCDTGYADGNIPDMGFHGMSYDEISELLLSDFVVISGGEPTVNPNLSSLITNLKLDGKAVSIETAGVKWIEELESCWVTFSPKETVSKVSPDPIFWDKADEIKIVITSEEDFAFYLPKIDGKVNVSLQPEWGRESEILPFIIEQSNKHRFRVSIQTHKHLGVR